MSEPIWAKKGDTFFTRSNSLLGRLIRWGEWDKGEGSPWTNHAGVVVENGFLGGDGPQALIVEALWHTRKGEWNGWKEGTEIRVFRPNPPYAPDELSHFEADANHYVGDKYGWWKLAGFLIKKATGINVPKIFFIDSRPICSYLAAKVNDAARNRRTYVVSWVRIDAKPWTGPWPGFGMDPQSADPDEMLDFAETHPEYWTEIK